MASCVCMVVRIAADKRGIPLSGMRATVTLNRDNKDESLFVTAIELEGELTDAQRATLLRAAEGCPVKKALSRRIVFQAQG